MLQNIGYSHSLIQVPGSKKFDVLSLTRHYAGQYCDEQASFCTFKGKTVSTEAATETSTIPTVGHESRNNK